MSRCRLFLSMLLVATLPALPALAGPKPDTTLKIDGGGWTLWVATFHGAGKLMLGVKAVPYQGRVAICGFVVPEPGNTSVGRLAYGFVNDTRILLGKTQLIPNADHFPTLAASDLTTLRGLSGSTAGCTLTKVVATPELLKQPLKTEFREGRLYD